MSRFILRSPIIAAVIATAVILSTAVTAARPCRTFIISSYSIRNPSTSTFATITEIRSLSNHLVFIKNPYDQNDAVFSSQQHDQNHHASLSRAKLGFTSLRDRTKDILSVVLALLFGFGCGSLVAAAMYLLVSAVSGCRDRCDRRNSDFSDEFSDCVCSEFDYALPDTHKNTQRR